MADYLQELREFMNIAGSTFQYIHETQEDPFHTDQPAIEVASDEDSIIESLELLRFKLLNIRQMEGSPDYALGYEEACIKVVEMIDGILNAHRSP